MIDIHNATILIVDDMESMCKSVRGMLKVLNFGKQFLYAGNGLEALKLLKKEENVVDLAIIDWNMPVMTGVELLSNIREDRDLRDMPVVMITAEAERGIVAEAAESEIDAYLLKPLTVKSLESRILAVLEKTNNPPPMIRHLRKAREHEENGDIPTAIKEAKLALQEDPTSSRPVRELGILYYKSKDLETAEKCFMKAAKMNRLDVYAFHYLGEIALARDDIDKASAYFNSAMKISPRHVGRGINFGKVLIQKGKVKKAMAVFEKAFEITKDPLPLREEIAEYCFERGAYNYAIALMTFLVQHMPERHDLQYRLGIAHEKIQQNLKALTHFLEAEKGEPENVDIKLHIARNYLTAHQTIRADQVLKEVMKLDPGNQEAQELLKKCV